MSRQLMKRGGKEGLRIRDCYQQRPRKRARPELQGTNPGKDKTASHGKKGNHFISFGEIPEIP